MQRRNNGQLSIIITVITLIFFNACNPSSSSTTTAMQAVSDYSSDLNKSAIMKVMTAVADWQIDKFESVKHHDLDWTNGALYVGMMEWAKATPNQKYMDWLNVIGQKYVWQPYFRMYHADDIVVSQMYLEMYRRKQQEKGSYRILGPTKARLDYVIAHPSQGTMYLEYNDPSTLEKWTWCDALFMAPPVYTKMAMITGDEHYLDFMHQEFLDTYDLLYDKEEHLFYRDHRYFPDVQRETNGEKIFWGRGNGWVLGGLVSILKELPQDHKYRQFYENLFKEMAAKIIKCQGNDGFWHASMLDHGSYPHPESSSSAFFCYGLAYGVNAGLLDADKYTLYIRKGWKALVSAIYPNGKLGWVQPIGQDPKTTSKDMTEVYGVGAFLLAGSELMNIKNVN